MVVATPPEHHAALALQGIRAGARVLIEKPVAATLADADSLVDASDGGAVVRCGENLLLAPAWTELMRRRVGLAALTHLSVRTCQPPPDWGHFAAPLRSGGVLFDLGPHPLALALGVARDEVVAVSAELSSSRDDGADDDATVRLRFASGLVATIIVSWTAPEVAWDLQAAAPDGVLRLEVLPEVLLEHDGEPVAVADRHEVADPRVERLGYVDQLIDLMSDEPVGQDLRAARHVLEVICAAYSSAAQSGSEVALPFEGDRSLTPMQHWRS